LTLRYVPDIREFGYICESNYRRITLLFPVLHDGTVCCLDLQLNEQFLGQIAVEVADDSRYTQTLMLRQMQSAGPWLNDPMLKVRLYHDARMAEVISAKNHHHIAAVNAYPNKRMHLPDEKLQLNRFLAEWLQYCLRHR
jgi:uncharacterized protein YqiB (DUF1249 family)